MVTNPIFGGSCLWVAYICYCDTKRALDTYHVITNQFFPHNSKLLLQTPQEQVLEMNCLFFCSLCGAESSGWMVNKVSDVYLVVILPRAWHPTFLLYLFKVIKKEKQHWGNWSLNVVSGTKCSLLFFFSRGFHWSLGRVSGGLKWALFGGLEFLEELPVEWND